jgi:hypothetical protein
MCEKKVRNEDERKMCEQASCHSLRGRASLWREKIVLCTMFAVALSSEMEQASTWLHIPVL